MSDLYFAAATLTTLLGVLLIIVFVAKNLDGISQALSSFAEWASENTVGIVAFFFLGSLAVTGITALVGL